jgi:uncharacterized protein YggL (DUF469 family)
VSEAEIRTVKRIAHEMLQVATEQLDMSFFQGLGFGLALAYEEMTGRTAADKKPQELMQWALSLPEIKFKKVGS